MTQLYNILSDLYLAIRNPFGIEVSQLSEYRSDALNALGLVTDSSNVSTITSMMLYYGWIPGILYFVMVVKGCFGFFGKNLIGLVSLFIMQVIINIEPHYMTLFFTVVFMYCVQYDNRNSIEESLSGMDCY